MGVADGLNQPPQASNCFICHRLLPSMKNRCGDY
jgi:hypothetical protein